MGLDEEHWSAGDVFLAEDNATLAIQHSINAADCGLGALNFAKVHGFENTWLRRQHRRIEAATRRWDDLAAAAMHCISVQRHVMDVEADATHVLVAQNAL